ncbi:MAG: hypothetical protein MK479_00695 [Planctomycetes bacterium]|nr:hypothetical protein [Planctomycetota bacterium]
MTAACRFRMIMPKQDKSIPLTNSKQATMRTLVIALIILLAILHHDWWWWDAKEPLVLGFMPVGLAWHAGISLAAGLVGLVAVKFCWPDHLDEEDEGDEAGAETGKEEAS